MDNRNFDNINERFGYEIEYYRWRHHIKQEEFLNCNKKLHTFWK